MKKNFFIVSAILILSIILFVKLSDSNNSPNIRKPERNQIPPAPSATTKPSSLQDKAEMLSQKKNNKKTPTKYTSHTAPEKHLQLPTGKFADPAFRKAFVYKQKQHLKNELAAAQLKSEKNNNWPHFDKTSDTDAAELMGIDGGRVLVYHINNVNAAITTAANLVRDNPFYGVVGSNVVAGVWDAGAVRKTHQEFKNNRVTIIDNVAMQSHATHIAGTIAAKGTYSRAKGMTTAAKIDSYDWVYDTAEMANRALAAPGESGKIQISNHSYGYIAGWYYAYKENKWYWYGTWGYRESDLFGIYSSKAVTWDTVCYNAPYYLPFKAAGNDRTDNAPGTGTTFKYFDGATWTTKAYDPATDPPADFADGGFDTIMDISNAKNIMTVGSVSDAIINTNRVVSQARMEAYSGWGPADDGRIKPDIVANGAGVTSTDSGSDTSYITKTGTSMATANATGSAALLVEYYQKLFNLPITSAMLKGLIIHTADDLPPVGPDYRSGWGLMNTKKAADYIYLQHKYTNADIMHNHVLNTANPTNSFVAKWDNVHPMKVTICWTDPPGPAQSGLDSRTPVLVNDLDLRVISPDGVTNFPFVLCATNPAALATNADNNIDNVEQIIIPSPVTGNYTIAVSHKGILQDGEQYYAIIMDGIAAAPTIIHEPLINTTNTTTPYIIRATIDSLAPLSYVQLFWSTNNFSGTYGSNQMVNVSNNIFSAEIPAQPLGTTISYYLSATTSNDLTTISPDNAPTQVYSFIVSPPVDFNVWGSPGEIGIVTPDYGTTSYPSGVVVNASASQATPENNGQRYRSDGWIGANDVPPEGESNNVSFVITRDSAMFWRWKLQYKLIQTSSVPGIIAVTNWWDESSAGTTVTAITETVQNSTTYKFAQWLLNGNRQPDSNSVAINPVTGIAMTTSQTATAIYLPATQDSDLDNLPDWWEYFYFGSLQYNANDDVDNDGYLNLEEYQDNSNPQDAGSMPEGPTITHQPLPAIISNPAPWQITAVVTDNNAVATVNLRWRRNGLNWRQATMTNTTTTGTYGTYIPAPGLYGDSFEYLIQATDDAGYITEDGPHNFNVVYPVIDIIHSNNFDFAMLKNMTTNSSFHIENTGNTNLVFALTMESSGFFDNIEQGTNGWTHTGSHDNWHLSTNRFYSGSNAWYCGNDTTAEYANGTDASLITPDILVAKNAKLTYMQWIKSELDVAPHAWDGGVVEISTNKGLSYQSITPEGGYPKLIVNNPDSPFDPETPCFAGTGSWEKVEFDLSAYAGSVAKIKFRFGSDLFVVDEGWYIDDVKISPYSITNDWITVNLTQGTIPQNTSGKNINVNVSSSNKPPRYSDVSFLQIKSNDPTQPRSYIPVFLYVESKPETSLIFAGQTSRDGSGIVTISNLVSDMDYDNCSLQLQYSTNNGATWTNFVISNATADFGSPVISNNAIYNIGTTNPPGIYTNTISTYWHTTNSLDSILLQTNVLIRSLADDGKYNSATTYSLPFIIDNESPSTPSAINVTSHNTGTWSTNRQFSFNWLPTDDGNGIGIYGYYFTITNNPASQPSPTAFTTNNTAQAIAPYDGTNLYVTVLSADKYGNKSTTTYSGPYMVDATPPSEQQAVISIITNEFGNYVLGNPVQCSWNGFNDNLSGITGYFILLSDNLPATNAALITSTNAEITNAVLNSTNNIYVRAQDNAGNISAAAVQPVLVLSANSDYDNDGINNADEDIAGTDATDAGKVFNVKLQITNNNAVISWNGITNRYYTLWHTTNLITDIWEVMPAVSNIPGINGVMYYTNNLSNPGNSYRVNVKR